MSTESPSLARIVLAAALVAAQVLYGLPMIAPLGEARAQLPPPRVHLGSLEAEDAPGAGLLSEKFDEAARKQLHRSEKVKLTDEAGMGQVAAGDEDPRVAQAETLRSAAKEAFTRGEFQPALENFRAALDLYEEALASVNKIDPLLQTLGYMGAASFELQYDADAKAFFKRVIAMAPDAQPLDEFSEGAKALYAKERKKLLKKKKGVLEVQTTPPGAVVRVDGIEVGESPVKVNGLVRGDHYVQVSHAEAGLAAKRKRVKGGKTRVLKLELSTEVGPEPTGAADAAVVAKVQALAKGGDLGTEFREGSEQIAQETKADYVVVGNIAPQGNSFVLTAYIYGVEQKQTAAFDEFRFRADLSSVFVQAAAFATAVEQAANDFPFDKVVVGGIVKAPVVVPAPPPVEPEPKPEPEPVAARPLPERPEDLGLQASDLTGEVPDDEQDDEDWYEKWWVWTLVGAAVAGGAAYGGYVLLQDDPQRSSFDARVRW